MHSITKNLIIFPLLLLVFGIASAQNTEVQSTEQILEQLTNYQKDLMVEGEGHRTSKKRGFTRVKASPNVSAASPRPSSIDLAGITFEFDSSILTSQAKDQLKELAGALASKSLSNKTFELIGHTDAQGSKQYNLDLSNRRALAVVNYLVKDHGIVGENIKAYGMGEERLANESNPNAPENRRVEVIVN